jgi:hypothetical protein
MYNLTSWNTRRYCSRGLLVAEQLAADGTTVASSLLEVHSCWALLWVSFLIWTPRRTCSASQNLALRFMSTHPLTARFAL